jgi:hypothetical protein
VIQKVIGYRKVKFGLPPADLSRWKGVGLAHFSSLLWFLALKEYKNSIKDQNSSLPKIHRVETSSILRKNVYNSAEKRRPKGPGNRLRSTLYHFRMLAYHRPCV